MVQALTASFGATVSAIAGIFLVILIAGFLVRRGVITQNQITGLSTASVQIFLPCLIFSNVVENLDPKALPQWWILPLAGAAMALVGTALGALVFSNQLPEKKDLIPVAGMQNAGYFVLPIGLALFPGQFDDFALYVFLFILGYNPILWSLGKTLISGDGRQKTRLRDLVTPPLVANIVAIGVALTGASALIPKPVVAAVDLLGTAAVPVATLVLGAVLGGIGVRFLPFAGDAVRALGVKLLLLPALTIILLHQFNLYAVNPLLADFFVIEAASAPAVGLVLQVRSYGGNEERVGTVMFLSYLACSMTLPAWVAVWRLMNGG